jgi:hypothetical protein
MMANDRSWRYVAALVVGSVVAACGASDRYALSPEDAEDANDETWTVTREPRPTESASDAGAPETPPLDAGTEPVTPEATDTVDGSSEMTTDAALDEPTADSTESTAVDTTPSEDTGDAGAPPSAEAKSPAEAAPAAERASPRVRWTTSGSGDATAADRPARRRQEPAGSKSLFLSLALMHGGLFGSDFEGTTALVAADYSGAEVALIPNPGADTGVLATIGVGHMARGRTGYAVALEYSQTWMSTTMGGRELGDGKLVEVALPLRLLFPASAKVIPYLETGGGLVTWWVENASGYVGYEGQLLGSPAESKSTGWSFDLGVGATVLLTDYFGIEFGLGYRALFFEEVNDRSLDDTLEAGRWLARVGPSLQL